MESTLINPKAAACERRNLTCPVANNANVMFHDVSFVKTGLSRLNSFPTLLHTSRIF